jgi:L-serine/L-threonine ammonia-lyase
VVTDQQALEACDRFLRDHRVWVEPACGAALAALDAVPLHLPQAKRVLVVVCGGVNVVRPG